ncbi:hypothetical protein [Neorhizobium galegae]|uniref:hypothetical protein n=1 Tax=Neorhizobium galegae TaxID=399 RepID=UPI002034E5B4|nr:hypothetical protein [Neorhizobium galegae]MCM2501639.1 hypothetical protein [Neorhizobium galegae]MCQ1775430.1 hypothetical protein [Neorhizobium galegae]MCQ1799957.1 hypothetical protein [Neorhizobium galegae]
MRSSPKETDTAAIPIHRVHPPSFWKGMILAATVIVLVPSSQVSAEDKGASLAYKNGTMVSIWNDYASAQTAAMTVLFLVYILLVGILAFGWERALYIPGFGGGR